MTCQREQTESTVSRQAPSASEWVNTRSCWRFSQVRHSPAATDTGSGWATDQLTGGSDSLPRALTAFLPALAACHPPLTPNPAEAVPVEQLARWLTEATFGMHQILIHKKIRLDRGGHACKMHDAWAALMQVAMTPHISVHTKGDAKTS